MKLEELMQKLNIDHYPEDLHNIYAKSEAEFNTHGAEIALGHKQMSYIEKYNMFESRRDELIRVAKTTRQDENLLRFLYLLKWVMDEPQRAAKILPNLNIPVTHEDNAVNDLSPIFSMFEFFSRIEEDMKKRGVPEDIIADTFNEFESKAEDFYERRGYLGISMYMAWMQYSIDLKIIRVERFNFEKRVYNGPIRAFKSNGGQYLLLMDNIKVHRSGQLLGSTGCEDEEGAFLAEITQDDESWLGFPVGEDGLVKSKTVRLLKSQWSEVLKPGDLTLFVHIPARMNLSPEVCESSYRRANEIYKKYYPEFPFRAICCHSWMMDPQLKTLLGKETNLTRFIDRYIPYPLKANGRGVMNFVFLTSGNTPSEKLRDDTSLRRLIKEHYLKGKFIYEQGGVFFDV